MTTTVKTQAELNAALLDPKERSILIDSPSGVWIDIPATGDKLVYVGETASISSVSSGGTVQEVSSGGTVQRVSSGGTVQEVSSGGTVQEVSSGGTVQEVSSGGTVQRVSSGGTVQEVSSGGTVQRAFGGCSIHLYGGTITDAGPHVAVLIHSASVVTNGGGQVIDLTAVDLSDAETWCAFHGVEVEGGSALLFKAVNDDFQSNHIRYGTDKPFAYPLGETVEAPDWRDTDACGHGLHFSPTPIAARSYNYNATRFLQVAVPLGVLRPITEESGAPKCKAKLATVLHEVDLNGDPITVVAVSK